MQVSSERRTTSRVIRDYLAEHPDATPKEVVANTELPNTLRSRQYVSNVKSQIRKENSSRTNGDTTISELRSIQKFANEHGGISRTMTFLETLSDLKR